MCSLPCLFCVKYAENACPAAAQCRDGEAATQDGDYSLTPLAAVHQLRKLFTATLRELPAVDAPALVFKSATDAVVPPSSLDLLRDRHAVLMAARPEKRPGEFKDAINYAGGYRFVDPELVLEYLAVEGWQVAYGPDIAPGEAAAERGPGVGRGPFR